MASQAYPNVYLESMEATGDPGNESNQVRNQTVQGTPVGQCKQRILGSRRKRYNAASGTHMQPSQSRLSLPNGLLCSIAQNVRNRRMPNGTYGGVRGRETKEIGGKLQESFVFLLLDSRRRGIQHIQHPVSFRTEPAPVNLNLASLKGKACPSP